jgi:hypothetical protein
MFEGVVSQVLAGLLGRYVKGIQKEQLKIGIWNGSSSVPSPPPRALAAFHYLIRRITREPAVVLIPSAL